MTKILYNSIPYPLANLKYHITQPSRIPQTFNSKHNLHLFTNSDITLPTKSTPFRSIRGTQTSSIFMNQEVMRFNEDRRTGERKSSRSQVYRVLIGDRIGHRFKMPR